MAEITAAAVKELREKTQLPMMECKRALESAAGDMEKAIEQLRLAGKKTMAARADRETTAGRIAIYADDKHGAMVELLCESAPVTNNDEFIQLVKDLAQQLATGPGASSGDALLSQPSPSKKGQSLKDQLEDLSNKIREVFRVSRILRFDGASGGYAHFNGATGALLQVTGGNTELAKDIAMHITAQKPEALTKEDLDPAIVSKERDIQTELARKEGKPENIIAKMIEGRLRNFFAERVLIEQPFVKDDKTTVGKIAQGANMKLLKFERWDLGK